MSVTVSNFVQPVFAQAGSSFRDAFLVLGILVVLIVAIFMLTLFIKDREPKEAPRRRKRSSRRSRGRAIETEEASGEVDDEEAGEEEESLKVKEVEYSEDGTQRRRKFRKRKKDHRPRNPTLAETGGLPAERSEDPPERPAS